MSSFDSGSAVLDRENSARKRMAAQARYLVVGLAFLAAIVIFAAFIGLQIKPRRARDVARAAPVIKEAAAPLATFSLATSRRKLQDLHEASARLAKDVLRQIDVFERLEREAADREVALREARQGYEKARSAREQAEFAVVEYEQGNARQEESQAAGEVFEARQRLERARHEVDAQRDQLAHVKGSTPDAIARVAASMLTKDRLRAALVRENDAAEVLDLAESRRQLLVEKIKPARIKDMRATAEQRKSEEQSWQARWDLEQSKFERVRQAALHQALNDTEKHVLALLDRGTSIEERIQVGLAHLTANKEADPKQVAAIEELTSQLESIVEEARVEAAAADDARLKPLIKAAVNRYLAVAKTNP